MPKQGSLERTLAALRKQYAAKLPAKIDGLDKAYAMLRAGWHPVLFEEFRTEVHKLGGEAGSYGFAAIGEQAKALDKRLLDVKKRGEPLSEADLTATGEVLQRIRQVLEGPSQTAPAPSAPGDTAPAPAKRERLLLPDNDKKLGQYLLLQWYQVEANWKALQWQWDQSTFEQLCEQLRVLLENTAAFQFSQLHEIAQHADKCLRDLRQNEGEPTGFQLANLNRQLQELAQACAPLTDYEYQEQSLARVPQSKTLRLMTDDSNLNNYLLLQVRQVENLWQTLQWNWHSETLLQLQNNLLILLKNCETFELSELEQSFKAFQKVLEQVLAGAKVPGERELGELNRLISKSLHSALVLQQQEDENAGEDAESGHKLIYVVEDDDYLAKYLGLQLEMGSYAVRIFSRLPGLAEAVKQKPPAALIVDIVLAEGDLAGPKAMFQIQKGRARPLPVIFMSARSDIKARIAAAMAHGDAYFTKPLDMDAVLAKLEELTAPSANGKEYQVLIVDNVKGGGAARYAKVLQEAQVRVKLLTDPLRFFDALEKFSPHLVLLNAHLQGVDAVALAGAVRQEGRTLPIVFYGMHFDQTWQVPVQRGIGDDFLGENVPPGQLLATVMSRLKTGCPKGEEKA